MADAHAAAITALIERYHERVSAGDIESVLDLWHDQGSVFEPGNATATGKTELRAAYERGYGGADYHFVPTIDSIVVDGNLASALSTAAGTITVKATGDVVPATARQMFTVERVGGDWKLLHYMFQEAPKS